jgi:hypothetical protein
MTRTPVPEQFQQQARPATERQVKYLEDMRDKKNTESLGPEQLAWLADADFATLTFDQASRVITTLKALPWQKRDQTMNFGVADGRYAIPKDDGTLMFYSVKQGKYITFVNVWASDARYPIKNLAEKRRILEAIKADPDAGPRFGREIGACYVCGRTLTDEKSRSLGVGPVCRGDQ